MNKASLITHIAEKKSLPPKQVEDVLDCFEETVMEQLQHGEEVTLTGFGAFQPRPRHARGGVNPQKPSERIQIPAVVVPKFKAGKNLKLALKKPRETTPTPTSATPTQ